MPGGVTGKAREGIPMSIVIVGISLSSKKIVSDFQGHYTRGIVSNQMVCRSEKAV